MYSNVELLDAKQRTIQLVSTTVVQATMRFKSTWLNTLKDASIKPINAIELTNIIDDVDATIHKVFIKPITPNLTKKPLKKIENSVDAST
jgi:hypothetical protein